VEQSYAPSLPSSRWRTATIAASALAALELVALVGIGVTFVGKSVAQQVRAAAIEKVMGTPVHHATVNPPTGLPKLARAETEVVVLNGGGRSGAAGTQADRLRGRGYLIGTVGNAPRPSPGGRTLVMYRTGYRAEGVRLAKDVGTPIVSPLDGLRSGDLLGAQVVVIIGSR
jgi:hypothetical protein